MALAGVGISGSTAALNRGLLDWFVSAAVSAAVCYRVGPGGAVEFLLVRTKKGRWTFPKGAVDGDISGAAAALREAYEEAGVAGFVQQVPFASFRHRSNSRGFHLVNTYLCEVTRLGRPLELYRSPTWFSASDTRQLLCSGRPAWQVTELKYVLDAALRQLAFSA